MKVIGITGPTGAGKTTVLRYLAGQGAQILDCDALYHEMLETPTALREAIFRRFPQAFTPSGELERKKLGKLVFADQKGLRELNELVYLHLGEEVELRLREMESTKTLAVIDAVNLVQSGLSRLCHLTVAVLAEEELRLSRIMERDGISRQYALSRMRVQEQDTFYEENCTLTLYNNGGEEDLLQRAEELFKDYLKGD